MTDQIRDTRDKNWFYLDNELLDFYGPKVGAYAVAVYNVLARYANNDNQNCYPSYTTIAKTLHISRNTVIHALQNLELHGLITITPRSNQETGGITSNLYTLLQVKRDMPPVHHRDGGGASQGLPPMHVKDGPGAPQGHEQDSFNKTYSNKTKHGADRATPPPSDKTTEQSGAPALNSTNSSNRPVTPVTKAQQTRAPKKEKPADPTLAHPAVKLYRETVLFWPKELVQHEAIIETVGSEETDLALWNATVRYWVECGWSKANVGGMLDLYRQGGPDVARKRTASKVITGNFKRNEETFDREAYAKKMETPVWMQKLLAQGS